MFTGGVCGSTALFGQRPIEVATVPDLVKQVLDQGADVNARDNQGSTALISAVEFGNPAVVKILLDRGADPEARGRYNYTALMCAKLLGRAQIVNLLAAREQSARLKPATAKNATGGIANDDDHIADAAARTKT